MANIGRASSIAQIRKAIKVYEKLNSSEKVKAQVDYNKSQIQILKNAESKILSIFNYYKNKYPAVAETIANKAKNSGKTLEDFLSLEQISVALEGQGKSTDAGHGLDLAAHSIEARNKVGSTKEFFTDKDGHFTVAKLVNATVKVGAVGFVGEAAVKTGALSLVGRGFMSFAGFSPIGAVTLGIVTTLAAVNAVQKLFAPIALVLKNAKKRSQNAQKTNTEIENILNETVSGEQGYSKAIDAINWENLSAEYNRLNIEINRDPSLSSEARARLGDKLQTKNSTLIATSIENQIKTISEENLASGAAAARSRISLASSLSREQIGNLQTTLSEQIGGVERNLASKISNSILNMSSAEQHDEILNNINLLVTPATKAELTSRLDNKNAELKISAEISSISAPDDSRIGIIRTEIGGLTDAALKTQLTAQLDAKIKEKTDEYVSGVLNQIDKLLVESETAPEVTEIEKAISVPFLTVEQKASLTKRLNDHMHENWASKQVDALDKKSTYDNINGVYTAIINSRDLSDDQKRVALGRFREKVLSVYAQKISELDTSAACEAINVELSNIKSLVGDNLGSLPSALKEQNRRIIEGKISAIVDLSEAGAISTEINDSNVLKDERAALKAKLDEQIERFSMNFEEDIKFLENAVDLDALRAKINSIPNDHTKTILGALIDTKKDVLTIKSNIGAITADTRAEKEGTIRASIEALSDGALSRLGITKDSLNTLLNNRVTTLSKDAQDKIANDFLADLKNLKQLKDKDTFDNKLLLITDPDVRNKLQQELDKVVERLENDTFGKLSSEIDKLSDLNVSEIQAKINESRLGQDKRNELNEQLEKKLNELEGPKFRELDMQVTMLDSLETARIFGLQKSIEESGLSKENKEKLWKHLTERTTALQNLARENAKTVKPEPDKSNPGAPIYVVPPVNGGPGWGYPGGTYPGAPGVVYPYPAGGALTATALNKTTIIINGKPAGEPPEVEIGKGEPGGDGGKGDRDRGRDGGKGGRTGGGDTGNPETKDAVGEIKALIETLRKCRSTSSTRIDTLCNRIYRKINDLPSDSEEHIEEKKICKNLFLQCLSELIEKVQSDFEAKRNTIKTHRDRYEREASEAGEALTKGFNQILQACQDLPIDTQNLSQTLESFSHSYNFANNSEISNMLSALLRILQSNKNLAEAQKNASEILKEN